MAAFAKRNPKMQFEATCAICSRLGTPNAHTPCHPAVREGVERGTELITLEINMRLEAPTAIKVIDILTQYSTFLSQTETATATATAAATSTYKVAICSFVACGRETHTHAQSESEVSMVRASNGREGERGGET